MTRSTPQTNASQPPPVSHTMESQHGPNLDIQTQMIQKFSLDSGMNIEYSKLLVIEILE